MNDVQWLVGEWVSRQPQDPSPAERKKQGAAAKRIVADHPRDRIEAALKGMANLYPHSNGTPWDLFDLERKFSNAAAATDPPMSHEDRELVDRVAKQQRQDRLGDLQEEVHSAREDVTDLTLAGRNGRELHAAKSRLGAAEDRLAAYQAELEATP